MEVKTDFSGYLNSDVAPHKILPTEYVNLQNFRIGSTTDGGRSQQLESIGCTSEIGNPYLPATSPYGIPLTIGSVEDVAKQRKIYFVWSPSGLHAIYASDGINVYKVLLDAQTESGLGFNKDYLIDARIEGNLVFYNDGLNEPKCLNIEAGIKLNHPDYDTDQAPYATPVKYTTATLIKRPPIFPVEVAKAVDNAFVNNFIVNNAYQFTYQYRYRDNQRSALAAYSALVPYNFDDDTYNVVGISIPLSEYIDDDIFAIDLCVKYGNFGKTYVIKSWDKDSDAAAIAAHNGGTALAYNFYDNRKGIQLSDVEAVNNFDGIPLTTQTLELARNRLFLGNNKLGYNTPAITSLTSTVTSSGSGESGFYSGFWGYIQMSASLSGSFSGSAEYNYPFAYSETAPNKFYYFPNVRVNEEGWHGDTYPSDLPENVHLYDATVTADTEADFFNAMKNRVYPAPVPTGATVSNPPWNEVYTVHYNVREVAYPMSILKTTGTGVSGFFKSASTYDITLAFYDRYRRKCGVIKQYSENNIPERVYSQTTFSSVLQWFLSNDNAAAEIPDWAYYYQIHITRNQTTRFFLQGRTLGADYVNKNQDGTYSYSHSTFTIGETYAVAIDLSRLLSFGLGYTFTEGDYIRISKSDDTNVLLSVIGTDGNFVFATPKDIGTLDTTTIVLIELFTPYKPSTVEPYYETGPVYAVNNPGTPDRAYSIITGILKGDAYALDRDYDTGFKYVVEAMSPNDKFWQIWQTDTGWPNAVDNIGQQTIKGNIMFSDVFIEGTKVNGLNKFQPLNAENLSLEDGALTKLKLTSKTQAEGNVMLAMCEKETLSMYIGESILTSSTGAATAIAKSDGVIAQINPLKGSRGTRHPESVVEFRGEVYWWDDFNGCFSYYAVNGLHELSAERLSRFCKLYSDVFKVLSKDDIRALGNVPFIVGGVNIHHKEIMWSIPKLGDNPNGILEDTGATYPYDFYDLQGKTVVFKLGALGEEGRFMGSYNYSVESFCSIGDKLYAFNQARIWLLDQFYAGYNIFFGTQYKSRVMFTLNAESSVPKIASSIAVESNQAPDYVHLRTEYPYIQSSDLVADDFTELEGIFYANVYRDRLSPNASGTYDEKLFKGDKIRGTYIYQMLEFDNTESVIQVKSANIIFEDSAGHKV